MVYLRTIIKEHQISLVDDQSIQSFCYYFIKDKNHLLSMPIQLQLEEGIAANGYKGNSASNEEVDQILKKRDIKGLGLTSNIFKLIGLYLASPISFKIKLDAKFNISSLKNQFLIARCIPDYNSKFTDILNKLEEDSELLTLLKFIYYKEGEIHDALKTFIFQDLDIIDLIIIEDLEKILIDKSIQRTSFLNKDAKTLVIQILENFRNAINKIAQTRRKGHDVFKINDEYDVQDLVYVILKPLFPFLKEEDPTPRVGIKSNKIDLIIREEGILIEIKMIKDSDSNEKDFVEQLKNDIQSYHQSQWLKYLICFIFDPQNKTRDRQNFYDLNGIQIIRDIEFEVIVIVVN